MNTELEEEMIQINLEDRIILYMDILGTKELLKDKHAISKFASVVEFFFQNNKNFKEDRYSNNIGSEKGIKEIRQVVSPEVSSFSDHLIASFPWDEKDILKAGYFGWLCQYAANIQKLVLTQGILMRGVITKGELVHEGNKIWGEGLNNAYYLESKIAFFPRIIIAPEVINLVDEIKLPNLIKTDLDGIKYVDYLSSIDQQTKDFVVNEMTNNRHDLRKLQKWNWLIQKLKITFPSLTPIAS